MQPYWSEKICFFSSVNPLEAFPILTQMNYHGLIVELKRHALSILLEGPLCYSPSLDMANREHLLVQITLLIGLG